VKKLDYFLRHLQWMLLWPYFCVAFHSFDYCVAVSWHCLCCQILGILDFSREAWIHREDWIRGGLYIGSNRKYRDSYYIQAQPMCYMNSWAIALPSKQQCTTPWCSKPELFAGLIVKYRD